MSAEYPIEGLADFLKVPEDKIDACLADFKTWISLARHSAVVTSMLDAMLGAEGTTMFVTHGFTWIDDGLPGIRRVEITNAKDPNDRAVIDVQSD